MPDQRERHTITDKRVLEALRNVDRSAFVPAEMAGYADYDRALPIGHGQTISQPYLVGLMTQALDVEPGDKILEIGTGSGYQAAILAELGASVYTIEIIPELAERAAESLKSQGYTGIQIRQGDGYFGWVQHAPYDGVILTAAAEQIPEPLMDQLSIGGRLVAPIGPQGRNQALQLFHKQPDGTLAAEDMGAVAFVPFTRSV